MVSRQELRIEKLAKPISHYTDAVRFGNLLLVSGLIAVDGDLRVVGVGDAAEQTRQIFRNMKLVLDEVGAGFSDILKVTVYLTDINDRTVINPVRQEVFGAARPASTLIEVSKLALLEAKVEIEAIVGLKSQA